VIVRIAAAASLLVGFSATAAYLHIMGRSPTASAAARHLRDMKDRDVTPEAIVPATIATMAAMPRGLSLAEYSGIERRAVSFDGHVQRMVRAADGDFHLELVEHALKPGDPDRQYFTAEVTPQWHRGSEAWSFDRLVQLFRPSYGGVTAWESGTRRVRISGWLLYDHEYEGVPSARPRLSSWEIHPVTRLEAWDDSSGRFVEHRR